MFDDSIKDIISSMNSIDPILEVTGLSRIVRVHDRPKKIIDDFSFSFGMSKIYNILGPSGSGKSSLLRLFNRLDEPSGGRIIFKGKDYQNYSACELRRRVGYLFQIPHLFRGTVRDNLLFANPGLTDRQIQKLFSQARVDRKLNDINIGNLSVGEKQRVALARLLAIDPEIILLDEPTSALDPANTEAIENLINCLIDEKRLTAIVVTHNPQQAIRLGGETLLLFEGKLIEWGTSERVVYDPRTEVGRRFSKGEFE